MLPLIGLAQRERPRSAAPGTESRRSAGRGQAGPGRARRSALSRTRSIMPAVGWGWAERGAALRAPRGNHRQCGSFHFPGIPVCSAAWPALRGSREGRGGCIIGRAAVRREERHLADGVAVSNPSAISPPPPPRPPHFLCSDQIPSIRRPVARPARRLGAGWGYRCQGVEQGRGGTSGGSKAAWRRGGVSARPGTERRVPCGAMRCHAAKLAVG